MELRSLRTGYYLGPTIVAAVMLAFSGVHAAPVQMKRITSLHHRPMQVHRRRDQTTSETYNWSGYAVTGPAGSVTQVQASWVVPAVNCSNTSGDGPNVYASFWTGIDGWNSNTVEQIGTDSDCQSPQGTLNTPTYYAWFEFYPQDAYYIGNPDENFAGYVVSPGDYISAKVTYTSSSTAKGPRLSGSQQFTVTITDVTRDWTFSTTSSVRGAQQSSAEWIAETPYGCNTKSGFCYLSDFSAANYGEEFTSVQNTAYATVSGVTQPLASFSNYQEAIMVTDDPSGTPTMAEPSVPPGISDGGTSFSIDWYNPGP